MSVHPEHLTYILNYKWIAIKLSVDCIKDDFEALFLRVKGQGLSKTDYFWDILWVL